MITFESDVTWSCPVPDEKSVSELAGIFSRSVRTPLVIYLYGELGAGKTTFARAFIHALGYPAYVKSPSYGLLESYRAGGVRILHLDLYRIKDPEELEYLALRDQFDETTVLLVEWPERGSGQLPAADLELVFLDSGPTRIVEGIAKSQAGRHLNRRLLT